MGFAQVRLEVVAINISNIAAFVRAGQTSPNIGFKHLSLTKGQAAVTGGRNSNATPAQSPNVVCYIYGTILCIKNSPTTYHRHLFPCLSLGLPDIFTSLSIPFILVVGVT